MSDVFGRKLRAYRKLKHWTQSEFAKAIGVSVAIVGSMERGTRKPTPELIQEIKSVLQVSDAELYGME